MPNWCENKLRITHSDPAALFKFKEGWNLGRVFEALIPCPKELMDTMSGSYGISDDKSQQYKKELHSYQEILNLKYFGYKNWYDYCIAEWGTKWDIGYNSDHNNLALIEEDGAGDQFIEVSFDSAWSPPINAYDKLVDLGYGVDAYYYEPGMAFCGRYDECGDQYFEIKGDSKWVRKNIPRDVEEAFNMIETMENFEEET